MKIKLLKSNFVFILLLLLIIPAFSTLLRPGYFPMHDDVQGMRLLEMDKCIKDLQIPCRWVPDMGYGYGYPQFNYYAPLPYYIMEIFVLGGTSILESVKIGFVLSVILSAIGMYLLGKKLWGKWGGLLSTLFYIYVPYRAVDMYVRGAVDEFWALVFLPFIFYFSIKVLEKNKKSILWLSVSFAGLFLSHNVTTLIFAPSYLIFILLYKKLAKKDIFNIVWAGFWGISMSAFFLIPAFFEKQYVHIETITEGYFNYLAHFVGIRQLLFSTFWGTGVSNLGNLDGLSLTTGLLHWTTAAFAVILLVYFRKKLLVRKILPFLIIALLSLFMVHPKSQFIWDHIKILSYVQFPWRFLALVIFAFSVIVGVIPKLIKDYKSKIYTVSVFFVFLILLYGNFFKITNWLNITDKDKFSGVSWDKQQTISIFDYLPVTAQHPPTTPAPIKPFSQFETIEVLDGEKGTNWQKWKINVENDTATIYLPIIDFPDWEVKVDGKVTKIDNRNELGMINISAEYGVHDIEAKLEDTPLRTASNLLTFVALLSIPVYLKGINEKTLS